MSGPLTLVLAESAIELVPSKILEHPAVVASARRKNKPAEELILDQNYHHAAIAKLGKLEKHRGRPDIAHISLLMALGSPLNLQGKLRSYVHTIDDKAIKVDPETRLPRQTERFVNLLEQLYVTLAVPPEGKPLLALSDGAVDGILDESKCDFVVALSTKGTPSKMQEVARKMADHKTPGLIVGGFSEGHFSEKVVSLANEVYSIYPERLEAWTVVARAVYDYERAIGL